MDKSRRGRFLWPDPGRACIIKAVISWGAIAMTRCRWVDLNSELYIVYHDQEWGKPEHDDRKLFEMLIL